MEEIILKSRILKDILGKNKIKNQIEFDDTFPDVVLLIDVGNFEFDEQDMIDLLQDWEIINRFDLKILDIKNLPENLKEKELIYSAIHKVPFVKFEGEKEYKEYLRLHSEVSISDELKERIIRERKLTDISIVDVYEYIYETNTYISAEDYKFFSNCEYIKDSPDSPKIRIGSKKDFENLYNNIALFLNPINLWIEDMSILSVEQIEKLSSKINIGTIYIPDEDVNNIEFSNLLLERPENNPDRYNYSLEDYIKLRTKVDTIIENIDIGLPEINKFLEIYQKLGENIIYSWDETTGEASKKDEAHNLIGPLLEGECVCEGYALAAKQVLKCVGIDCKCVEGKIDEDFRHAWNQVKINGKWYNFDLTWDAEAIAEGRELDYCLKSDEEFIGHDSKCKWREKCSKSYDRNVINKIVESRNDEDWENDFADILRDEFDETDIHNEKLQIASNLKESMEKLSSDILAGTLQSTQAELIEGVSGIDNPKQLQEQNIEEIND